MKNTSGTNNYKRNIRINYGFIVLKNLNLTQGIWMLLLVSRGQSLLQVGILEGIFHVTSFFMETPTGVVADLFGRKASRLIGVMLAILSSALFITSGNFFGYAVAFVISALSYNFESGAGEALIYDSLLLDNKEEQFMKVTGNLEVLMQLTGVIALLLGGFIGSISYVNTYLISIGIAALSLFLGLGFVEPKFSRDKSSEDMNLFRTMKKQMTDVLELFKGRRKLIYLLVFSSTLSTVVTVSFYYIQVAWKGLAYNEGQIGMFLALSNIVGAIGGTLAYKIDAMIGETNILRFAPLLFVPAVFLFGMKYAGIGAFAWISFLDSIIFVTTRNYIHKLVPSEKRATVISFESTLFSLCMIGIFPVFGAIAQGMQMMTAFYVLGGLLAIFAFQNMRLTRIQQDRRGKKLFKENDYLG